MNQYPADALHDGIEEWVDKKIELINQYKADHPNYMMKSAKKRKANGRNYYRNGTVPRKNSTKTVPETFFISSST